MTVAILVSVLLAGLTGGILSSVAAIAFGDHPFAVSVVAPFTAPLWRAIMLTFALVQGWDQGGRFLEMHVWLAVGAVVNFVLIRRAATSRYARSISS
jgi:uncharacterized membrane protein YgaE (UPF0421/DUF939 family)